MQRTISAFVESRCLKVMVTVFKKLGLITSICSTMETFHLSLNELYQLKLPVISVKTNLAWHCSIDKLLFSGVIKKQDFHKTWLSDWKTLIALDKQWRNWAWLTDFLREESTSILATPWTVIMGTSIYVN